MKMHIPVQGTCHPSVRKSFFFGDSFGSFCSFTFDPVAFGTDLGAADLGCTFGIIFAVVPNFQSQLYRVKKFCTISVGGSGSSIS